MDAVFPHYCAANAEPQRRLHSRHSSLRHRIRGPYSHQVRMRPEQRIDRRMLRSGICSKSFLPVGHLSSSPELLTFFQVSSTASWLPLLPPLYDAGLRTESALSIADTASDEISF
jgi:hypothetical protein